MSKLALFLAATAATAAALSPIDVGTAAAVPSDTNGGIRVPLASALRSCDFGRLLNPFWGKISSGQGEAVVRRNGNTVIAEVAFVNTREPGLHYDVGLIQLPRPASPPCGPGAPGTAFAGMDTDAAGRGSVTLQDAIRPGTTGVWVKIDRPGPHAQDPVEFYSSSFIARI